MCSHYETVKDRNTLKTHFKIDAIPEGEKPDMWPGYLGAFIRKRVDSDAGDGTFSEREMLLGSFGLIPHWATDSRIARNTYNARSETVAEKPSFRDAGAMGNAASFLPRPSLNLTGALARRFRRESPAQIENLWVLPDCGLHGKRPGMGSFTASRC